ncbi:MoaB/Mog domain-containing protein [Irpex rosettiformis]|uniref:MoaB/Mog domain-containing protein n=1 Tax=Irpex rosettiformis TaxID=378272 RepID=A0ACB8UD16_9APHY|nr:MoaB/Mog domain-containing protein [Irpex rosettiformis]
MPKIRVAILTVSDTASQDPSTDQSGPAIAHIFTEHGHECTTTAIVPDDEPRIRDIVKTWSEEGVADLIITTGGTGFGVRDRTPEAISPLIERQAPGIVHLLLASSLQKTPFAALSRPVAGTIRNTLVVTLPGSVKAVEENTTALLSGGVAAHAVDLIKGGSGHLIHAALAEGIISSVSSDSECSSVSPPTPAETQLHHHHHFHHHRHHQHGDISHSSPQPRTVLSHDPSGPVSARHRISPYPLHSLEYALGKILTEVLPLPEKELPVTSALSGYILAEDVFAPNDAPRTATTNVDGYAVRSTDPPGIYKVLTSHTLPAGQPVPPGHVYRINTGAPLPPGTDAVLMVEDTRLHSTSFSSNPLEADQEENEVDCLAQLDPGENVRTPGSDAKEGDLVLEKGTVLHAHGGEIGTLAFVGRKTVQVYKKPIVAILSTGNELVDLQGTEQTLSAGEERQQGKDGWSGIWDVNRPSLRAALEGLGYTVLDLGIVPDDLQCHITALRRGLADADIVLTTGGTSMGASDLLKPVIERHLDGTIHFGRVKMKPGKPTTFATVPSDKVEGGIPVFALPGNPASALVTFHVFVVPALRRLGGWPVGRCHLPRVRVKIHHPMTLDPRVEFHRVIIRAEQDGLKAYSTGGQRSSRVASLAGANGLVSLPVLTEGGPKVLEAGEYADAIVIGELHAKY